MRQTEKMSSILNIWLGHKECFNIFDAGADPEVNGSCLSDPVKISHEKISTEVSHIDFVFLGIGH